MYVTGYMYMKTAMTSKAYITKRAGDPKVRHQTKNFSNDTKIWCSRARAMIPTSTGLLHPPAASKDRS